MAGSGWNGDDFGLMGQASCSSDWSGRLDGGLVIGILSDDCAGNHDVRFGPGELEAAR
jgi:hypothetical protein